MSRFLCGSGISNCLKNTSDMLARMHDQLFDGLLAAMVSRLIVVGPDGSAVFRGLDKLRACAEDREDLRGWYPAVDGVLQGVLFSGIAAC
jgi:hypothetical protein